MFIWVPKCLLGSKILYLPHQKVSLTRAAFTTVTLASRMEGSTEEGSIDICQVTGWKSNFIAKSNHIFNFQYIEYMKKNIEKYKNDEDLRCTSSDLFCQLTALNSK